MKTECVDNPASINNNDDLKNEYTFLAGMFCAVTIYFKGNIAFFFCRYADIKRNTPRFVF